MYPRCWKNNESPLIDSWFLKETAGDDATPLTVARQTKKWLASFIFAPHKFRADLAARYCMWLAKWLEENTSADSKSNNVVIHHWNDCQRFWTKKIWNTCSGWWVCDSNPYRQKITLFHSCIAQRKRDVVAVSSRRQKIKKRKEEEKHNKKGVVCLSFGTSRWCGGFILRWSSNVYFFLWLLSYRYAKDKLH